MRLVPCGEPVKLVDIQVHKIGEDTAPRPDAARALVGRGLRFEPPPVTNAGRCAGSARTVRILIERPATRTFRIAADSGEEPNVRVRVRFRVQYLRLLARNGGQMPVRHSVKKSDE